MAVPSIIPRGALLGGKYRVDRELGRGGMAAVYQAINVDINKRVAIKLLAGHLTASQTVVERFLREARAVSAIKSPHICEIYDSGRLDDNTPFLVLELLEGESLYDAMCRDRQMSPEVTLSIILQAGKGLAKAHEAGIVHRDLKPENIFLTVDGDGHLLVKVLDFGLAKFYDPVHTTGKDGKAARLTREGAVFGTPAYMSPEQVRGQAAADTRADLWALACITYECFTGTTVWSTEDGVAMTFAQIATAPIPDARKYRPDLPLTFNDWFNRALDRDINVRFQTISDFADGLVAAFAYEAQRGGLDGALITQITNEAANAPDSETITARARAMMERRERASPLASSAPSLTSKPAIQMSSASPSSVEVPAPQQNLLVPAVPAKRGGIGKVIGGLLLLLLVAAAVVVVTTSDTQPAPQEVKRFAAATKRFTSASPTEVSGFEYVAKHPWLPLVREAQALVAQGEHERALSILRRVYEQHRHGMIRNMMDQVGVAVQGRASGARCLVNGIARPRRADLLSQDGQATNAGPPTIVRGLSSAVMTWTDSVEGQKRAYAVPLDDALRNRKLPIDITPEGSKVYTPKLLPVAQRFVAAYWDAQGAAAGVYVRWLDSNAVIAGAPLLVSENKPMAFFATAARRGEGFVVAWIDQVDADAMDVFFRSFDKDGKPTGEPVRVTDYVHHGASPTRLRDLQVAVEGDNVYFAYLVVRGGHQQIRFLAVPADTKAPGLEQLDKGKSKERVLGTELRVSPGSQKPGLPSLGCMKDGCFIAWHLTARGGGGVAFVDGKTGKRQWHKKFTRKGKRPALAIAPGGNVRMVWTEGGRIITATLGREGVGPSSKVARVVGEHSPPSVAAGMTKDEWYVSWLDFESGHREPYAIRMVCQ